MARSRLLVRETGTTKFVPNNGDYPDEYAAHQDGTRLCELGSCDAFEVWALHSAFEREVMMRRVGDE